MLVTPSPQVPAMEAAALCPIWLAELLGLQGARGVRVLMHAAYRLSHLPSRDLMCHRLVLCFLDAQGLQVLHAAALGLQVLWRWEFCG